MVPSVEVKRISVVSRPVVVLPRPERNGFDGQAFYQTAGVILVQHFHCKNIGSSIFAEIGKIYRHRIITGVSDRQRVDRPERTVPLIYPDPVGCPEIIAHIKILLAVSIQIVKFCRKAPIRAQPKRVSILIPKALHVISQRKCTVSVVEVQLIFSSDLMAFRREPLPPVSRSEERRVGKERTYRSQTDPQRKNS